MILCAEHAEKNCDCYPDNCKGCNALRTTDIFDIKFKRKEHMTMEDITLNVGKRTYRVIGAELTQTCSDYPTISATACIAPHYEKIPEPLSITNVIFNPPATIIFWSDGTKTVVKCNYDYETYDPEKGIAMAIARKMLGNNKYEYYNIFKHWLKKWNRTEQAEKDMEKSINDMDAAIQRLDDCLSELKED